MKTTLFVGLWNVQSLRSRIIDCLHILLSNMNDVNAGYKDIVGRCQREWTRVRIYAVVVHGHSMIH